MFDDYDDDTLSSEMSVALLALLGEDGFYLLLETYAGTRLYVPHIDGCRKSQLAYTITIEKAEKLAEAFGGEYIKVPLGRTFRALIYRQRGLSQPKIARLLGMSESGVYKLLGKAKAEGKLDEAGQAAR